MTRRTAARAVRAVALVLDGPVLVGLLIAAGFCLMVAWGTR